MFFGYCICFFQVFLFSFPLLSGCESQKYIWEYKAISIKASFTTCMTIQLHFVFVLFCRQSCARLSCSWCHSWATFFINHTKCTCNEDNCRVWCCFFAFQYWARGIHMLYYIMIIHIQIGYAHCRSSISHIFLSNMFSVAPFTVCHIKMQYIKSVKLNNHEHSLRTLLQFSVLFC